ncbi:hypothetical protein BKA70DRAFT_1124181 [Coprinopsis sp. MPI-PUGE-AT-0042]|nr:hypothetical protein BKA70DRAFT_1124181 [Coprinopsis sp. MPI-PUGE-AT-0042]
MAKKTAFAPKEPIAKLPLAVRKDLRDKYEAEKEEWETKIAELLGVEKFTINFNANAIWAYAEESSATKGETNAGKVLADYAKGFIHGLTAFIETYGDEGKQDFVKAVHAAEIALDINPLGEDAPEILDAEIRDGVWTILFKTKCLDYNVSRMGATEFVKVVDAARTEGFSLKAKNNIEEYYTDKIDDLKEKIATLLNMEDVVLDPNFEENYQTLKAKKKDDEWQERFGKTIYEYFEYVIGPLVVATTN